MKVGTVTAIGMALALGACAGGGSVDGECAAVALQPLVGQPASAAEGVPEPKRVLPAGSAYTQDYVPERTNVSLGEDGTITRIWCG